MERINEIWSQLECNPPSLAGLLKVRYSESSFCDAFLGCKYPECHRMLIIKTPFTIGKDFKFQYNFRGLKFEKIYDPDDTNFILLNLVLVDRQFKDVFDSLIADVISNIINETTLKVVLKNYTNRLVKWQSLFERFNPQGLSGEQQRGLYGELFFLRKLLNSTTFYQSVLHSWVGPEQNIVDFQSNNWALEVKTTHSNNHQKIYISSERQLDTTNLESLFLYHISLDQRQNSGETLNQAVDSVSDILQADIISSNLFKSKLMEIGYYEQHRHLYEEIGYFIRQDDFYIVEDNFPRIEENDIRSGVGDVKYSIVVSMCSDYIRSEQFVFNTIIFNE